MSAIASIKHPPVSSGPAESVTWTRLHGSAAELAMANALARQGGRALVVCRNPREAERTAARLAFYSPELRIGLFPDLETLPYEGFSPHPDLTSQRLETLAELRAGEPLVLITAAGTLLQRLPPAGFVARALRLSVGDRIDVEALRLQLHAAGYSAVSQVVEHGEYAVRGSVIDLFPMGQAAPIRLDLFDDEIEAIRRFDPATQRSEDRLDAIRILPAREFPLDAEGIRGFRQRFRARFEGDPGKRPLYREISDGRAPGGTEYYLPLFFDETAALTDYVDASMPAFVYEGALDELAQQWAEIEERYEQLGVDPERPLLPPAEAFWPPERVRSALESRPRVVLDTHRGTETASVEFATTTLPPLALDGRSEDPVSRLTRFIDEFDGRILLVAESPGRRELLQDLLRGRERKPVPVADWRDFMAKSPPLGLTVASLDAGLVLSDAGIAVVAEDELFAERAVTRSRARRAQRDPETIIRNLTDLNPGAPVVHEDHGVGRYLGLVSLPVGEYEQEFLALEYAGGDKLYVPVQSLDVISRYTGASPESAPLHRLGSDQWARARRRAAEKIRDVAAELLDVYARRAARERRPYTLADSDYRAFAAAFPFEETEDQQSAIGRVIDDLRAPEPMDRVVCGDVGFGKTEVALRASFVAVQDGRQVAVLVPTTLLAQQHYRTFADRFADWPVRVEMLSRFRTGKRADEVIAGLADGSVDIVIGTHKLLSQTIRFKRLGLAVIDEEHRFGVRHKEALKALRSEVDVLTLTATPIPRTLNMALGGLRELSLITTPPPDRLAVRTFVTQWSRAVIREACLRELKRGGQIYFIHNTIETIDKVAEELETIVPEASIRVAHGQMRERELENIMLDFYHRRFDILLCTTIVESGIDVPTANTILINRADRFGLAQLHQLRGRVGRSHHRAYAYLLAPPRPALTADAVKRLEAIESLEELGAGFTLASHDLEIRGAGELLGEDQSGQIHEVGFSLYMDLLTRAVDAIKAGREPALEQPLFHGTEVEVGAPALLPESYLPDVHQRLILYKRIASAEDAEALDELQVEMIDRFGLLPEPAKTLFRITRIKQQASALGIRKLDFGERGGRVVFHADTGVDPLLLVGLVQTDPRTYALDGGETLRVRTSLPDAEARFGCIDALLERLSSDTGSARPATG